ncbi:hypothetical protein FF38_07557 [Lucilia cuprina]|uniref:Uncharacterized protein n=1 Tax=Lucilia cuprina TaxID=7375 RepID=A0A0L0BM52_LUCCU|nr:hypothetical protein FF38_07557 [Lucilia cuprina]
MVEVAYVLDFVGDMMIIVIFGNLPLFVLLTPWAGAEVANIVAAAVAVDPFPIPPAIRLLTAIPPPLPLPFRPAPATAAVACNFKPLGMLTVTFRPLLITPLIGGDDEINDDDEETPLDEDGDGEGVEGVGEPRVTAVADIFLAVNDNGRLLPNVTRAVGLPAGGLLMPPPPPPP